MLQIMIWRQRLEFFSLCNRPLNEYETKNSKAWNGSFSADPVSLEKIMRWVCELQAYRGVVNQFFSFFSFSVNLQYLLDGA